MKSDPDPANTALVLAPRPQEDPHAQDDVRLQSLWLATQRRPWRSLAVLGASEAMETLPIAEILAKIAWWYQGEPSCIYDLRDVSMRLVDYQVREVHAHVDAGVRVVVALRSMFENPTAVPIAQQVDAVVLCIDLGKTEFKAAERTLAELGRERVLGSIVVRPRKGASRSNGQ